MRKLLFTIAASLLLVTVYAQNMKAVKLNTPDKARGTSVMKALSDRHSDREFAVKELSLQDLSIYYGRQTASTVRTASVRLLLP